MTQTGVPPLITTLLVSYNTRELLDPCLAALRLALLPIGGGTVVVVDNASRDGSAAHLAQAAPDVTLIRSGANLGFGRANNLALAHAQTPFVLLLNTDAFIEPDGLRLPLAYMASNPNCGILGVRLVGRDGDLQPCCRYFPTPWNQFLSRTGLSRWLPGRLVDNMDWPHDQVRDCDWVPGCYYLVRKEVIDQVGLFDPRYFLYFEEVDHCRAAKQAGWRVVYFPFTQVVHLGGESARKDGPISKSGRQVEVLQLESALLYFRKNHGVLGLLAHLAFEGVADMVLMLKALLKGQGLGPVAYQAKRLQAVARLLLQTKLGTKPTR
ncbi:MAG: glycosyltransferase family 2 protein [Burkholderiales bacterium]|nr:glycosyltransferase family 2 protein [Burkholderiales bacterium]